MNREQPGERVLQQLLTLARAQAAEAPLRERHFVERLEERLEERRRAQRRSRRRTAGALALAACLCVALLCVRLLIPSSLSYRVADGAVVGDYIESKGVARVHFSDGSEVALAPGTRARVEEVTAHGALVELGSGQVTVNVVKAPQNAWSVKAGPYTVLVTGTAFDVRWISGERRFELELHHGSVTVTGPSIGGSLRLTAGQKLRGSPGMPVTVDGPGLANTPPVAAVAPALPAPSAGALLPGVEAVNVERARDPSGANSWTRLVAQGKFQEVIAAARKRGLDEVLASGSLADLKALADAARYARNPQLARQALLGERRRFPGSAAAKDASFFLGGLEDEGARASIVWYERYLAESPRGAYTSQALGARLMLYYRQNGLQAAMPLAKEYLERFPKGPYASAARKILDRSQP